MRDFSAPLETSRPYGSRRARSNIKNLRKKPKKNSQETRKRSRSFARAKKNTIYYFIIIIYFRWENKRHHYIIIPNVQFRTVRPSFGLNVRKLLRTARAFSGVPKTVLGYSVIFRKIYRIFPKSRSSTFRHLRVCRSDPFDRTPGSTPRFPNRRRFEPRSSHHGSRGIVAVRSVTH